MTTAEGEREPRLRVLGEYIRVQRHMADLSLRQLAELTQVSNAYLSQVERGLHEPSLRVLRAIAGALNVSAATLLAQAGLIEGASGTGPAPDGGSGRAAPVDGAVDTETAIRADPHLSAEEKAALLSVYRNFRRRRT